VNVRFSLVLVWLSLGKAGKIIMFVNSGRTWDYCNLTTVLAFSFPFHSKKKLSFLEITSDAPCTP